jgi:hypothetical protein
MDTKMSGGEMVKKSDENETEIAASACVLNGFSRVRGISDSLFNVKFVVSLKLNESQQLNIDRSLKPGIYGFFYLKYEHRLWSRAFSLIGKVTYERRMNVFCLF